MIENMDMAGYDRWINTREAARLEAEAAEHDLLGYPKWGAFKREQADYMRGLAALVSLPDQETGGGI